MATLPAPTRPAGAIASARTFSAPRGQDTVPRRSRLATMIGALPADTMPSNSFRPLTLLDPYPPPCLA